MNIAMALNTNKELKTFYSITEVSEMFGISASNLRFWEKEFPSIKPRKSGNNVRRYTKEDIEEIRLVYDLVKVRNMKLSTARELLHRNKQGAKDSSDLMDRLQNVRAQLMELKRELDGLT